MTRHRNGRGDIRDIQRAPGTDQEQQQHQDVAPVSVVIPCYNQAHFLGEAIESVLAQSYTHFEIIVVDDGSTDNTSEVAAHYTRARCIRQGNQGLSGARNTGVRESRGSYLVFLDADDRLLPNALEVGIKCMESHPECAFVSGRYREIAVDGSPLSVPQQSYIEKDHYAEILRCKYITAVHTVMHRRAVFEYVGGFDTSWSHSEDADLCLRIAREYPVHCHGRLIAEYRVHDSSWSHNFAHMLESAITVRRSQQRHVKGNRRYERAIESGVRTSREYYGRLLARKILTNLRKRECKQAIKDLPVLVRYYPQVFVRGLQKLGSRYLRRLLGPSVSS